MPQARVSLGAVTPAMRGRLTTPPAALTVQPWEAPLLGTQAFFSFSRLKDDRRHREYNEWHQLDHVPEVLTDPDVAAAARWVRSPVCAAATVSAGSLLGSLQYVNMYWYRRPGPLGRLAPLHFQLGRRADLDVGHSLMAGVFRPVKGYVSPRIALGPDAIPLRPARRRLPEGGRVPGQLRRIG